VFWAVVVVAAGELLAEDDVVVAGELFDEDDVVAGGELFDEDDVDAAGGLFDVADEVDVAQHVETKAAITQTTTRLDTVNCELCLVVIFLN